MAVSGQTGGPGGKGLDGEVLLARARSGCTVALGTLFESIRGHLLLAARRDLPRHLRARLGASDLVQEAVCAGHRDFRAFRGGSSSEFLGWMRSILSHTVIDTVRRQRAARRSPGTMPMTLSAVGSSHDCLAESAGLHPEPMAIRGEEAALVAVALDGLPADQRRVLWLRHWEGKTFPEIAVLIGRSDDAARKLWCRGFERLGKALRDADQDDGEPLAGR